MKGQSVLIGVLAGAVLQFSLADSAFGYSLLLPDVAAGSCEGFSGLPYAALADHYTGPACVQMALNSCPDTARRACHTQADLYSKVLLHNSEPLSWFSDPDGVEGTLEDPTLSPCGNWTDYSNTDKAYVLGKMLYYMRTQRYLTPVSIGAGEHWVTVIGYETNIEPPFSGSVTLNNIFFYDPLPGSPSLGWVSGNTWLLGTGSSTPSYWQAPLAMSGSAWDGKYIAVIEPPKSTVVVKIPPPQDLEPIVPPKVVLKSVQKWLKEIRERELAKGPFEILGGDLEIRTPVLVDAERPYYLVRFEDDHLAAVFDGSGNFEELRLFEKPQKLVSVKHMLEMLEQRLREHDLRLVKADKPALVFRPELSRVGRVAPTWEVSIEVSDATGRSLEATMQLDTAGKIVGGLDKLLKDRRPVVGKVLWELMTRDNMPAPVQRAAIEPEDETVYLATYENLYTVEDGVVQPASKPPAPGARLGLAPGGGLYAWLIPTGGEEPYWEVHLRDIASAAQVKLKPQEAPSGFGGLYLGHRGKLIVTVTPLDDWRGIRGRYRYTFWSRDGQALGKIVRPAREIAIVAADGSSLLLLGEKAATAYSSKGDQLWSLEGRYRKGAIAKDGTIALLNPSNGKQIHKVMIFNGSDSTGVREIPTPVHHLVLTPDGSGAVVGGDGGRYFHLDPASGDFKEGKRLPFDRELFLTEIEFVDHDTLAFGVLQREGDPPQHTWPLGGIALVTRDGEVLFRQEFPIDEPYASRPAVDGAFGEPRVIGFTIDTAVRVEFGR